VRLGQLLGFLYAFQHLLRSESDFVAAPLAEIFFLPSLHYFALHEYRRNFPSKYFPLFIYDSGNVISFFSPAQNAHPSALPVNYKYHTMPVSCEDIVFSHGFHLVLFSLIRFSCGISRFYYGVR